MFYQRPLSFKSQEQNKVRKFVETNISQKVRKGFCNVRNVMCKIIGMVCRDIHCFLKISVNWRMLFYKLGSHEEFCEKNILDSWNDIGVDFEILLLRKNSTIICHVYKLEYWMNKNLDEMKKGFHINGTRSWRDDTDTELIKLSLRNVRRCVEEERNFNEGWYRMKLS